jgi:hypothetical protein
MRKAPSEELFSQNLIEPLGYLHTWVKTTFMAGLARSFHYFVYTLVH